MKRNILVLMAVVFSMHLMGQKALEHVAINQQYGSHDTLRTFSIINIDLETGRNNFIQHWGTPARNEAGKIEWENLNLGLIGEGLNITLEDRICTRDGDVLSCRQFSSEQDKSESLLNLKANQFRTLEITISNAKGQNVVNDAIKSESAAKMLNRINL